MLIIFISIKLVGLHSISHNNDDLIEDCDICEFVITQSQNSPNLLVQTTLNFFLPKQHFVSKKIRFYNSLTTVEEVVFYPLFSRPPPCV